LSGVQILIADDHELFRRTVRSYIESQPNWTVCGEAGDGIEAVEKARPVRPDVVLMDINMPRMDGMEAARIIRRELPDSKVIVVTQNHDSIAREQAAAVNAHAYVTKSDLTRQWSPTIQKVVGRTGDESTQSTPAGSSVPQEWLRGGGALARLVHEFDWRKTPLGPIEKWQQSLKTIVRVLLTSRFAMWMSWGTGTHFFVQRCVCPHDAWKEASVGVGPTLSGRVGGNLRQIGPRIHRVLQSGEAT
jgi:CheY-like chemotaxis protein